MAEKRFRQVRYRVVPARRAGMEARAVRELLFFSWRKSALFWRVSRARVRDRENALFPIGERDGPHPVFPEKQKAVLLFRARRGSATHTRARTATAQ